MKAFECIPVRFLFWDGDDEFPAQGNVLFDASATDFIHGESVVTIAAIGLDRIAKFAGVPLDRSTFPIFYYEAKAIFLVLFKIFSREPKGKQALNLPDQKKYLPIWKDILQSD